VGRNYGTFPHAGAIRGAVSSHDERCLLTWSQDGAGLWAVDRNQLIQAFLQEETVVGARFNPDESGILTWAAESATAGTTRLWVIGRNEPLQTLKHKGPVLTAVFNRDASRILTTSVEPGKWQTLRTTAQLWAVGQNELVQTFGDIEGVMFNRDGNRVLSWAHAVAPPTQVLKRDGSQDCSVTTARHSYALAARSVLPRMTLLPRTMKMDGSFYLHEAPSKAGQSAISKRTQILRSRDARIRVVRIRGRVDEVRPMRSPVFE
jgi:hypothetical protein